MKCPMCTNPCFMDCPKESVETNEEWFASLSTEEKAEFLSNSGMFESCNEALFWLKEVHKESE